MRLVSLEVTAFKLLHVLGSLGNRLVILLEQAMLNI